MKLYIFMVSETKFVIKTFEKCIFQVFYTNINYDLGDIGTTWFESVKLKQLIFCTGRAEWMPKWKGRLESFIVSTNNIQYLHIFQVKISSLIGPNNKEMDSIDQTIDMFCWQKLNPSQPEALTSHEELNSDQWGDGSSYSKSEVSASIR